MNTDSFYTKGSTHRENQDYACHGEKNGQPFAVISDGCSSAPRSDFGARLLVQSAVQYLGQAGYNDDSFGHSTINTARSWSHALGLSDDSLCATLLIATVADVDVGQMHVDQKMFKVLVAGDGFVVACHKDHMEVNEYKFTKGAPCYLRYSIDPRMTKDYWTKFGDEVQQRIWLIDNNGKSVYQEETMKFPAAPFFFKKEYPVSDYLWVAVMSDGGSSFITTVDHGTGLEPAEVPVPEVMRELLGFKNFQGEFVQRRCGKAFKEFVKKNWQNADDVSIAVIARN